MITLLKEANILLQTATQIGLYAMFLVAVRAILLVVVLNAEALYLLASTNPLLVFCLAFTLLPSVHVWWRIYTIHFNN